MPQRGPAVLTLALTLGVLGGACRKQPIVETPNEVIRLDDGEQLDAPEMCTAACQRLERCVPELAGDLDGDPTQVAERLARECSPACQDFADPRAALAIRDCTQLDSCTAFWGCVGTADARAWLATVAPVGERTCENLCSQASACAIAKVCETETGGRKRKPGSDSHDGGGAGGGAGGAGGGGGGGAGGGGEVVVDAECLRDDALRNELEERCALQCRALPEAGPAQTELIGCIDHVSCGGMLGCLEGWAETDYADASGPTPGISPSCDAFCTRAIVCGAADSDVELEPDELAELKQVMTSTYVECAVQCAKDLEAEGEVASERFATCASVETCAEFESCADAA